MLLVCLLSGCSHSAETYTKETVMKEFLSIYWTQNYEGRYQQWRDDSEIADSEEMQDSIDTYYISVAPYVTDEELEILIEKRMPLKYEALAAQRDASYSIQDIQLEEAEEEIYNFNITLLWKQAGEEDMIVTVRGDIRSTEEGKKVDYYYESNVFPELIW